MCVAAHNSLAFRNFGLYKRPHTLAQPQQALPIASSEGCCGAGHAPYNPVSGSPAATPARPRYSPSQSPEKSNASAQDPLDFLNLDEQIKSQQPAKNAPAAKTAGGRKAPAYQPPSGDVPGVSAWLPQTKVRQLHDQRHTG